MMLPSHLLAAVALGLLFSMAWRPFTRRDWALALGFGVAIDLDHLLQFPAYVHARGVQGLHAQAIIHWGPAWQGFMHTPWALLLVVPAMLAWRTWIPLVFWGLHMFQDFVVATRFVVFGSWQEWVVVACLAALVGGLLVLAHRKSASNAPFHRYVLHTFARTQA